MKLIKVSLVVPLLNEEESIKNLCESIYRQSFQPDEVVLVDGGSTDKTVEIVEKICLERAGIKLVKTDGATPGKGRNIGTLNARNEWIAYTDAGIKLSDDWLAELVQIIDEDPESAIVYGNYSPVINNFFEKCAMFAFVPPQSENGLRGKSIASSLIKKDVWKAVGGFPDLRAAEDLIFMETAEKQGFRVGFAPKAMIYWQLRPNLSSTFQKFVVYSKYNVWAERQWDWHYGIAKQYLLMVPFLLLAVFHSWWWLTIMPAWLFARTAKRILLHRYEYRFTPLLNPLILFGVAFLIIVIDLATFIGWIQAILRKNG